MLGVVRPLAQGALLRSLHRTTCYSQSRGGGTGGSWTRPATILTSCSAVQVEASQHGQEQHFSPRPKPPTPSFRAGAVAAAAAAAAVGAALWMPSIASSEGDLPIYTREEVAKHKSPDSGIWVIHDGGVYDITEFVENHPGGASKIMLAAGGSVDPFWRIYQQHVGNDAVKELLADMQIGRLSDEDAAASLAEVDANDPYSKEPATHPALTIHYSKPVNAEIPPSLLMDSWVTPNELWYVRHHHPVPVEEISLPSNQKVEVSISTGLVRDERREVLRVADLKARFKKREVMATMQCGGNRRDGLDAVEKSKGTGWDMGAISNAEWGGVWLRDILSTMGVSTPDDAEKLGIRHVQFESHDSMKASIPIEKVLNPYGDVLIAYEMNGVSIPASHGFPLRVIVPGFVGVRNVKWLKSICFSDTESDGPWQQGMNYKVFSPSIKDLNGVDIDKVPTIQEQPVQSVIVSPLNGEKIEVVDDDEITIKGYSWSGGGKGIIRVDVSIDNGITWHTATLKEGSEQNPMRAWAWTFWETTIPLSGPMPDGKVLEICCKATDYAHNCQPETPESIWNLRGLNNNSWHRVRVSLEAV